MKKHVEQISRRLDALEKERSKNQKAAERECFLDIALTVLLAYFVGDLKPKESPWDGYARALKFKNHNDFLAAFVDALRTGNGAELQRRQNDAVDRLFSEFRYDRSSQEALDEAITKMEGSLPEQWRAWIATIVDTVDYDEERELEERIEQIRRTAETMAAAELRARKK